MTENLHTTLLERCTLTFSDPRVIDTINGCGALAWYREQRAALGFGETDFEHVTLTDPLGVNAHLSCEGGKLVSGRDLCPQMTLRLAKPDTVLPRMQAFYDDPDALIFGCAGLKGILPAELHSPGLGLFLFGEVCTVNVRPSSATSCSPSCASRNGKARPPDKSGGLLRLFQVTFPSRIVCSVIDRR